MAYVELLSPSGNQLVNPSGSDIYIDVDRTPGVPTNVLSRNVGNGNLEVEWTLDGIMGVDTAYCNVYISTSPTGPWTKANKRPITNNKALIENIPFNTVVYAVVTQVTIAGLEGAQSALANDGYCVRSTIGLLFTGPVGDQIPIGAMFSEYVGDGNLIGFTTTASGQMM